MKCSMTAMRLAIDRARRPSLPSVAVVTLSSFMALTTGAGAVAARADTSPVLAKATPPSLVRTSFGEVHLTPTVIVGGAPGQSVRVSVHPSTPLLKLGVALRRPRLSSTAGKRSQSAVSAGSWAVAVKPGAADPEIELPNLDPPAGEYRLQFRADTASGSTLTGEAVIRVVGQSRAQPAAAGFAAGGAHRAAAGESPLTGPPGRALVGNEVENDINRQPASQAETYTAVQPNDSSHVIAAVNPSSGRPQAWVSHDSMRPGTQFALTLPAATLRPTAEGGGTVNTSLCCDPAFAADTLGNFWYGVLSLGSESHIIVNRLDAQTDTFQPRNTAIPRVTTCGGCQDKPMLTMDNWPASPNFGTLSAVWTENQASGGQNIVISQCATMSGGIQDPTLCDDPDNWSLPTAITDTSGSYIYASVAAAPSGELYATWVDYSSNNAVMIDVCPSGADCTNPVNWGPDTLVHQLDASGGTPLPFFCPIISAPAGRVSAMTYVRVGPDGSVYVVFSDLRSNGTTKCRALPTDQTFDSFISTGLNGFPTPGSEVRLSNDDPSAQNDHFFPTLAVDPSTGEAQSNFYSTLADPGRSQTHQYYVSSSDGGTTFSPMSQITTEPSDFSGRHTNGFDYGDYTGADAAGGQFFPSWTDNRASNGGNLADMFMLTPPPL
ncbi:MAG: hypothetical protein NVSMB51_12750 [Solirubrobacteraceae bacterium]